MGIKILLADDSVTAQNMGKKILSDAGHEVVTVSNGAAAAKKIAEIKPELVLLDVFMPGYSGLELCEKLRSSAETSKLPVLLTVGRMEPYNSQDGARVKADGVIVKPFEASDLTAAVDRLAEKAKPNKSGDARGIKIVPKAEPTETTTRLDAQAQGEIESAFGVESGEEAQKVSTQKIQVQATPAYPAEDFQVAPALPDVDLSSHEESKTGTGEAQPAPPSIPSYMSQYLSEPEPARMEAAKPEIPLEPESSAGASGLSIHDQPTVAFPKDFLQSHSQNEFTVSSVQETPISSVDGLELTAAAPVPEMPITPEPGLELTLNPTQADTAISKDPALVTDPHRSTMDFPTRFASSDAELAQKFMESLHASAEPVIDSGDEFEARLGAAMASYEEPAADLPPVAEEANSNVIEMRPHLTPEHRPENHSFEAQVDNAMHGFELPELGAEAPPLESQIFPAVTPAQFAPEPAHLETEPSPFSEHSAQQTPQYLHHVEAVSSSATAPIDAAETADISDIAARVLAPDTDDALIQQMREGLSHVPETVHPAEASEHAPMAMAAAASAESVASRPTLHDTDSEVARAMAAAMGRELATETAEFSAAEGEQVVHETDANSLASAVETVMKRELPNLIWKIMAELDLRKRQ